MSITKREQALWDLLDDIDTGFDVFKPTIERFEQFVRMKVMKRHEILWSDGYVLNEPPNDPAHT